MQTRAADEIGGRHDATGILIVRQHPQDGAGVELQVDAAFHRYGPLTKVPGGISTVPIPDEFAELIAVWMAVVLVVTPSPTAPKLMTLFVPGGMVGNTGVAALEKDASRRPSQMAGHLAIFVKTCHIRPGALR